MISPDQPARCIACGHPLEPAARFCSQCGRRQGQLDVWILRPLWILVLSFTVLGPFALPLVWVSRGTNRTGKIVVSAVIILYTVFVFYVGYLFLAWYFRYLERVTHLHVGGYF
ncbi:MAG: zinc ribbon domain-containing protein [Candidatus Hydrogenedentes bacterium]|nr:zinc ribbon domain-containing protein [Candidatus Hydrogenedentota bacterium]